MNNKVGNQIKKKKKPNDVIYTPKKLATLMINLCDIKPEDKVLDPSRGKGIFYDNLPTCKKDWCEITDNKDFFKYDSEVDIIVGNPPYSLWTKWIKKTIDLNPDRFCYIFGALNLTPKRLKIIFDSGYIVKKIYVIQVDWWFGNQFVVYFKKGEIEDSILNFCSSFGCDICNTHCKRGRYGNDPNKCALNP